MCGEYGEKLGRPHFHSIIFGYDFPDKKFFKQKNETILYTSEELKRLWKKGHVTVGSVSSASAGYVARYTLKKINGELAEDHYRRVDEQTGENIWLEPEYANMSRRPGLGRAWYAKFKADVFPDDFLIIDGKKIKTPQYYLNLLREEEPEFYEEIKQKRLEAQEKNTDDNTHPRLMVREKCLRARTKNSYEATRMIHQMFTVYDEKARAYLPPFFLPQDGMAVRAFAECINSKDHQFGKHPHDFTLFNLGTYDDEKAIIMPSDHSISLGNGLEFKLPTQNEQYHGLQTGAQAPIGDDSPVQPGAESGNSA